MKKPLKLCVNGDGRSVHPPSWVLCKECSYTQAVLAEREEGLISERDQFQKLFEDAHTRFVEREAEWQAERNVLRTGVTTAIRRLEVVFEVEEGDRQDQCRFGVEQLRELRALLASGPQPIPEEEK